MARASYLALLVLFPALLLQGQKQSESPASDADRQAEMTLNVVAAVPAEYPHEAVEKKISGAVSTFVTISASGMVEHAQAEDGDPILQAAALEAAKKYKFQLQNPSGNIALKCWGNLVFDFQLRESGASLPHPDSVPGRLIHWEPFPNRIRVPAATISKMALKTADPFYGLGKKLSEFKGEVVLDEIIGTDGKVKEVSLVSGPKDVPKGLVDSLKQWEFKPYLFYGEPVEVETQISLKFMGEKRGKSQPLSEEALQWMLQGPQYISTAIVISASSQLYPENAKQNGIRGDVLVTATISEAGSVQDVRAVRGAPQLTDAAVEAVLKAKGTVHVRNGKPEEVHELVTVHFVQ